MLSEGLERGIFNKLLYSMFPELLFNGFVFLVRTLLFCCCVSYDLFSWNSRFRLGNKLKSEK